MNQIIEHLSKNDPVMQRITASTEIKTLRWSSDVFEDIVSCILDMQIRYRGKSVRYLRLKEKLKGQEVTPQSILKLDKEILDYINMSGQKWNALNAISNHWKDNDWEKLNWHQLSDDEVRKLLLQVKGIGNWTVDMILLFSLQRPDVFPLDDMHLKKIMANLYEIEGDLKTEMLDIAEYWKPYRSTGVLYLLEYGKLIS